MLFSELILDSVRKILFRLTEIIYLAIRGLYNLFIELSKFSLFTFDEVSEVYKRFEVILAVVMVFYVSFTAIKYIVNPEMVSDKEKGGANLLKKMVVVVILMIFSPQIFEAASNLRTNIIDNRVIPQIITGETQNIKNAGGEFSSKLLSLFYYAKNPNDDCTLEVSLPWIGNIGLKLGERYTCGQVVQYNLAYIREVNNISGGDQAFTRAISREDDDGNYKLNFDALYAIGVGLFVAWVFINYCAEAARVIFQMMFLEIIAPIPIMSYLSPSKDGTFQKWVKQLATTYFDVLIRLFVIYLMFFFSGKVLNEIDKILAGANRDDKWMQTFLVIFLIIGLLYFASKAPALIKELLPKGLESAASGSFGLGKKDFKDRFNPSAKVAGAALGLSRGPIKGAGRLIGAMARDLNNNGNPFSKKGIKKRYNAAREGTKKAALRAGNRIATRVDRWLNRDQAAMDKRARREDLDRELAEAAKLRGAARVAKRNEIAQKYLSNKIRITELEAELDSIKDDKSAVAIERRKNLQNEIIRLKDENAAKAASLKDKVDLSALDKLATSSGDVTKKIKDNRKNIEEQDKIIAEQDAIINSNTSTPEEKEAARKKKQAALASKQKSENAIRRINDVANKEKVDDYVTALSEKEAADKAYNKALQGTDDNEKIVTKAAKDAADNKFSQATEAMFGKFGVLHSAYNAAFKTQDQAVTNARQELLKSVLAEQNAHSQEDAAFRAEKNLAQQNGGIARGLAGFVGGTISGAAKGVAQGLKTKDIGTVLPDYVKGVKSDIKQEEARQEFISNGGVVGIGADLSRLTQQAGKIVGVPTQVQSINTSIKPLENMAKGEEATMKVEKAGTSAFSSAMSSIVAAREGHKAEIEFSQKDEDGNVVATNTDFIDKLKTLSGGSGAELTSLVGNAFKDIDIGNNVKIDASLGKNALEDFESTRELILALHSRSERLKQRWEQASRDNSLDQDQLNALYKLYVAASDDENKLTKAIDRLTMTEVMNKPNDKFVDLKEEKVKSDIETMRNSILAALSNSDTVNKLLTTVSTDTLKDDARKIIRAGNYDALDVDMFKQISDGLEIIAKDREAELAETNEIIRQAKDQSDAKKTQDTGYNGGSGGNNGGSGH